MKKPYKDLREFLNHLETLNELKHLRAPVSPVLEMTAVCDSLLKNTGAAVLFHNVTGHSMPVLGNLFGTTRRVALGMGANDLSDLRDIGRVLATLKEPDPPKGIKDAAKLLSLAKTVWSMAPKTISRPACQAIVIEAADVDLARIPVQTCWPGDVNCH